MWNFCRLLVACFFGVMVVLINTIQPVSSAEDSDSKCVPAAALREAVELARAVSRGPRRECDGTARKWSPPLPSANANGARDGLVNQTSAGVLADAARYTGCEVVRGNLELTHYGSCAYDLSFLHSITEVTGYVIFYKNDGPRELPLPQLRLVRGNSLIGAPGRGDSGTKFAIVVESNRNLRSLGLRVLTEVTRGAVRVAGNPALRYSVQWADVLNSTQAVEESELEGEWREQSKTPSAPTTTTGPQLIEEVEGSGAPPEISTTPPLQPTSPCLGCDTKFCWGPVSPPTGNPTDCQTLHKLKCGHQCHNRCYSTARQDTCCSDLCSAGCRGPTSSDCYACRFGRWNGRCTEQADLGNGESRCPNDHYYNKTLTRCEKCNPFCEGGCTGPNDYWGNGGCASCNRAVVMGRKLEKRVDGTPVRHFCVSPQDYCDTGYFQINAHGLISKTLICQQCKDQCLACEDNFACSVCKGVRKLAKHDEDLLNRITQFLRKRPAERNAIAIYGKQSLLGSCESSCGGSNWTYHSARYTRAELRLTRAEAVSRGWFCEERMNGMTDDSGVNVPCRREDDLCLSCDEGCDESGCSGPGPEACYQCKFARVELGENKSKCVTSCPSDKPFRFPSTNGEGFVCSKEITGDMKAKFDEADKNHNNALDPSEIAKFFELAGIQMGGRMQVVH